MGVNISKILMYLVICQLPNLAFIPFCVILPSHDAPCGHLTHFQFANLWLVAFKYNESLLQMDVVVHDENG